MNSKYENDLNSDYNFTLIEFYNQMRGRRFESFLQVKRTSPKFRDFNYDIIKTINYKSDLELFKNLLIVFPFYFFSKLLAYYSSGLTTSSYVDMLKYVYEMEENDSFVIGEGGECIRNFYEDVSDFERYITPKIIIDSVFLGIDYKSYLERFKINQNELNAFGVNYYRESRLTGNFSKRHSIITPFINKITPFLNTNFSDLTYSVSFDEYKNESVHRYLINLTSSIKENSHMKIKHNDTQVWNQRISTVKKSFLKVHNLFDYDQIGIRKEGVEFCLKNMDKNKRIIYFILRLYSMINFISHVKTSEFGDIEKKIISLEFNEI